MATANGWLEERIGGFAQALSEELGEVDATQGVCWLDALENQAIKIGDAVQAEFVKRRSRSLADQRHDEATCPACGKRGRYQGLRKRDLVGRRGPLVIHEPPYYCPSCRRAFFPDDCRAGN